MAFIPLFHQVKNQRILIVGGGNIALRKAHYFTDKGLSVDVLSPAIGAELNDLVSRNQGRWFEQDFSPDYFSEQQLSQYWCIIAATNQKCVNEQLANFSKANNIMVNVVDNTSLCDVILPSVIAQDSLVIAISNSGSSPILSRMINQQIEQLLPAGYGKLSAFVGKYRVQVNESISNRKIRLAFWHRLLQGDIAKSVMTGSIEDAEDKLAIALVDPLNFNSRGEIALLSVNVTEADLLSLRALRLIQPADVVVYHQQVSAEILSLVNKTCQRMVLNNNTDLCSLLSKENQVLLIEQAGLGKKVVYLTINEGAAFNQEAQEITSLVAECFEVRQVP